MHPKVRMFLTERDRAYERRDSGVVRSMNVELRRLGVSDDATLSDPAGRISRARKARERAVAAKKPKNGLPRCEHENVADRCEMCNPELAAR